MKRVKTYFLILPLLALAACGKQESVNAPEGEIRFSGPRHTKATDAVNRADVFQIRDWYNERSYHIENTLLYDNSEARWNYGNDTTYKWDNGTHLFFGWLSNDDHYSTDAFFGPFFALNGTELSIPAKTMNSSIRQYDFMYSDGLFRSTSSNDYSEVPLLFKHLFAQVSMSFKVSDETADNEQPITLKRAFLNNTFKNRKSATIEFADGAQPGVTFDNVAADGYFTAPVNFNLANYGKGAVPLDMLSQTQTASPSFYYVWPTPTEDLYGIDKEHKIEDIIRIEYSVGNEDRISLMSFPRGTVWKAGQKYQYTVTYMGGIIKVSELVLPWDYYGYGDDVPLTVEDQSVQATWLGWDSNTCSVNGTDVSFITYPDGGPNAGKLKTIHGMFRINSPTQCTYNINMTQNAGKYSFSHGTGQIGTSEGDIAPGAVIDFYISARDEDRPAAGQEPIRGGLSFSVRVTGGRDYSLDSELQHDGVFNIIIPSM